MSTQAQKGSLIDVDYSIIILIKYHSQGDWLRNRLFWLRRLAELDEKEAQLFEAYKDFQTICLSRDME